MKKFILTALSILTLLAFAACTDTVADISTSDGGEVEVTESEVGTVEEDIDTPEGDLETKAKYEAYTITYTDPDGYTVTEDGGGSVTYTIDGYDVGTIVYVPATVTEQVIDEYYAALQADMAEMQDYVAQYASGLDVDYTVETTMINGQEAMLVTGTVAAGSVEGNPGDTGYVLIMPMGDQLIVIRGFANAETAEMIEKDLVAFAESIQGTASTSTAS